MWIACSNSECVENGVPKDTLDKFAQNVTNGEVKCGECGQPVTLDVTAQVEAEQGSS